jgi:hypothetical protein
MVSLGRGLRPSDVLVLPPPFGIWTSVPVAAPTLGAALSSPHASPEATAFAFGAMLQREYGSDWPRLIQFAIHAAMNADHGIADPCFSPADMG